MDIIINRNQIRYVVDVFMGIFFIILFLTGLMKWPNKAFGNMIPSNSISLIHDYSGILLGIFVLIHLILNWTWILNMTKKIFINKC